jgi:hypothetical protein
MATPTSTIGDQARALATASKERLALGILTDPAPDSVAAQAKLGLHLTEVNADAAGIIRWIDVHPNYTTRSEVPGILAAVDAVS